MPKCKKTTRAGDVLEQEVFDIADNVRKLKSAEPRPIILTDEDRQIYNAKKSRKRLIRTFNATFAGGGLYGTFTFDNKHLPQSYSEAEHCLELYIRRLRDYSKEVRVIGVVGYGKKTNRLHVHVVISGVPAEIAAKKWKGGRVARIEPLREHNYYSGVNCGRDYTGLAKYLFKHTLPKTKGRRWKQSNVLHAKQDKPTLPRRTYTMDKPPRTPKGYRLVECRQSGRYYGGYLYFKYVKIKC